MTELHVSGLIFIIVIHAGHLLAHGNLVRHCADTFLASEHKDIRMEAVRTCSRLLSPSLHVSGKYKHVLTQIDLETDRQKYGWMYMQIDKLHSDIWFKSSEIKYPSLQPMVVPNAAIHHVSISASSTQVVSEVLSKMLMVGITDPGNENLLAVRQDINWVNNYPSWLCFILDLHVHVVHM